VKTNRWSIRKSKTMLIRWRRRSRGKEMRRKSLEEKTEDFHLEKKR